MTETISEVATSGALPDTLASGEDITPWRGVGTTVSGLMSIDAALSAADLEWDVELSPEQHTFNGEIRTIPKRFVSRRVTDGLVFGTGIGGGYHPIQNRDAFKFADHILDTGEAQISTAGRGGAKVFMTMKLSESTTVAGEPFDGYLMLSTTHDGKGSLQAAFTTIRVACQNQVTMALKSAKSRWSMTHRTTLEGRVAEAQQTLQLSHKYQDEFAAEVEALLSIPLEKDQFLEMEASMLPESKFAKEKKVDMFAAAWEHETTPTENTGWKAINAHTFATNHLTRYLRPEVRMKSLMDGDGAKSLDRLKTRVLALA